MLSKQQIDDVCGVQLRKLGFVSLKNNAEWYGIIRGRFFCSVFFNLMEDVLFRVQPLCSRLLDSVGKKRNTADIKNHCEFASLMLNKPNCSFIKHNSKEQSCEIDYYIKLMHNVVLPYFNSLHSFSDIFTERDWWISAATAYLDDDFEKYRTNKAVIMALTNINHIQGLADKDVEFLHAIRKSSEQQDMGIVGGFLQKQEIENIDLIRLKLPRLFKCAEIKPSVTDSFIKNTALNKTVTTKDFGFEIPEKVRGIYDIDFVPFPMSSPIIDIDGDTEQNNAKRAISSEFSEELKSLGFVPFEENMLWVKPVLGIFTQRIWFKLYPKGNVQIYFDIVVEANSGTSFSGNLCNSAAELLKLVGSPILFESYPNPFSSGSESYNWAINRLKCQLYYIVLPRLAKEQIKRFSNI